MALTRREVCTTKNRPELPAAERALILRNYGVPNWTGRDGEMDHRVPFFSGGTTDARNVWPEPGPSTNNEKDKLERYVYRRVCTQRTMRVSTARRIFLGDWRVAYHRYIQL